MEKLLKMKLNNNPILLKLDLIELVELHSYEREIGREFGKETKGASSRDSQGKLRPLRFGNRGNGVFNKK